MSFSFNPDSNTNQQPTTGSVFGQPSQGAFGSSNNNSSSNTFGQPSQGGFSLGPLPKQQPVADQQQPQTTASFSFGPQQPATQGLGSSTTSQGAFGSSNNSSNTFGQPQGGFGTSTGFGSTPNQQPVADQQQSQTTTGFSFGQPQQPATQTDQQPQGFSFGQTTPFNTPATTSEGFGTAFGGNNNGFGANFGTGFNFGTFGTVGSFEHVTIPKYSNSFSFAQSKVNDEFSDLNIEIYDENGLFSTISTHRLIVGLGDGVLASMVKNCTTKKNEKFTLELFTSLLPESKYGKIKAIALQHAINTFIDTVSVHINDALQVLLVLDYFGITFPFQAFTTSLTQAIQNSEHIARVFAKNFNSFLTNYQLPPSTTTHQYYNLFRETFNSIVKGKDLDNQTIVKELNKSLFENELRREFSPSDLPKILSVIDVWISSHLNLSSETAPFQICAIVDNLQVKNPQTLFSMIQVLSSSPSPYHFVNSISPEWKLKLINKYIMTSLCQQQPNNPSMERNPFQPAFPQPQTQPQQPLGFF